MDQDEYRRLAKSTAVYPEANTGALPELMYLGLGLAGEAGEVANKIKKLYRDGDDQARRAALISELGDVLWYWVRLCEELGLTLEQVRHYNAEKLLGRQQRGTLGGSGEDR